MLLVVEADTIDENDVADVATDLGIIAWRVSTMDLVDEHDAVLDAFGTILDYISATLNGEFDAIDEDEAQQSSFGVACAGAVPNCVTM